VDEGFLDTDADGAADCVDEDDDGDGVVDQLDNCPLVPNQPQLNSDSDMLGDACDADDDNDLDPDETDCAPTDPLVHHGAAEVCGNNVDENCDGEAPPETFYGLAVSIANTAVDALDDGSVRIVINQQQILAHLANATQGLRAFPEPVDNPYLVPYAGLPLFVEHLTAAELVLWVRLTIEAQSTETIHIYYGPAGVDSVADGESVFDFYEDFAPGSLADWKVETNFGSGKFGQELATNQYHSAPTSLRDYLQTPGIGCQPAKYAYSKRQIDLASSGLYHVTFYARSATCGGCTMYSRVFLDSSLIHNVYNPGPKLALYGYATSLSAGQHQLKTGMYTTLICSGKFTAYADDIMIGRTVSPTPSVSYSAADEITGGCM